MNDERFLMKPYQKIPIVECGEPLVPIPVERFAIASPHPYQKLGATYGERSPYYLRQSVLNSLLQAQTNLELHCPGWRIEIFDAYRPVSVQEFMVIYTFTEVVQAQGLNPDELSDAQRQAIWEQVYQFWAPPTLDPHTPPPHSTGAAVDITLVDETGQVVDMGTAIDEISPASHPNYFANATLPLEQQYHRHRQLLKDIMLAAGFAQHPNEWWHFCLGDQMWAWLSDRDVARYGRL
jgi:D-alanyl-D-alanine dipeptidase